MVSSLSDALLAGFGSRAPLVTFGLLEPLVSQRRLVFFQKQLLMPTLKVAQLVHAVVALCGHGIRQESQADGAVPGIRLVRVPSVLRRVEVGA
jgi:hypothetical protein